MNHWIDLAVVFSSGCILGGIFTALWLRGKLEVYRRLVERHLDSIDLRGVSPGAR